MIAPRVALEEIILWVLEKEPVHCAAEGNVCPHDPVGINSLAEGMTVWEQDQSVGPCSMSDLFPLGEVKVRSCKRGEIAPKLRLHFQNKRKRPRYYRRRAGSSAFWPAMVFLTSCGFIPLGG